MSDSFRSRLHLHRASWLALVATVVMVLLAASGPVSAAVKPPAPFVYRISMQAPHRHEFQVELSIRDVAGDHVDLRMAKWNPGSYRLTEAHKNVRAVVARDEMGRSLDVEKLDETAWRVHHGGKPFVLGYRVYASRYTGPRGAFLDDAFGFFDGVYVFMYVAGHENRAIDVRVRPFAGGKVVTALPARGRGAFRAADFETLVDAPVQVGNIDVLPFRVDKVPFRMAMTGVGNYDRNKVTADVKKIVERAIDVFGGGAEAIPFSDYTFIYQLRPRAGGGLEHRNSTVIGSDPWIFDDDDAYVRFLSVTAHEFFHLWNVKRIRPAVLGPFAWNREVHTSMLWFSEGFTSYYAWLLLSRAGHRTEKQSLKELASEIRSLRDKPGRKLATVEHSSWETWLRPDDAANSSFSYYNKGMLIGALVDLELRGKTDNRKSLDGLYRELWGQYRRDGRGLTRAELRAKFIDYAGMEAGDGIKDIFAKYVRGVDDIDWNRYLVHAGYRLELGEKRPGGYIGVDLGTDGDLVTVDRVVHGDPGDVAGLAAGDVLLAIDGHRVSPREADRRVSSLAPGTRHELTLFRGARLVRRVVRVERRGKPRVKVKSVDDPAPAQLAVRKAWLGLE